MDDPVSETDPSTCDGESEPMSLVVINTEDLVGRTYLVLQSDGQSHRAHIVKSIADHK